MSSSRVIFWKSYYGITRPFRKLYWRIVQPQTRGVKAVVRYGEKFLLVKLAYAHKEWTLPGGGVDKRETFEHGAWRECKEETGIVPDSLTLIGEYKTRVEGKHDTVQCFFGEAANIQTIFDPIEIAEVAWFSRNRFPVTCRPAVEKVMRYYDEFHKI